MLKYVLDCHGRLYDSELASTEDSIDDALPNCRLQVAESTRSINIINQLIK